MEWVGCLALILLGSALIAAALNPDVPILRSLWAYRVFSKDRIWPTRFERQETALVGGLIIVAGVGLFAYVYLAR
jgi:hypothetical protein